MRYLIIDFTTFLWLDLFEWFCHYMTLCWFVKSFAMVGYGPVLFSCTMTSQFISTVVIYLGLPCHKRLYVLDTDIKK